MYIRALDRDFHVGDRADVGEDLATYLVKERGDFVYVDESGDDFEINGWLDNDYQDRADAVLEGGLDDHLDAIEEAETSDTVLEAVDERRAELED
ncbi:hypothetical protein [Haloplanus litoreus]|uniref:DUF5611 domain-containing protein n=1 Tax=Haloplanus litoreus TaxID=767515 RepID=A0ABD6A1T2_9EURY